MNSIHNLQCPLCEATAQFQSQDFNNLKHIRCQNCSEFIISSSEERRLATATLQQKKDISKNATSAPAGKILVVTRSAPSNSEDKAQAPFHQEYKPRQEEVK